MRSSKGARRRAQSGQSLVEALVAAAVLGVGMVTALTGVDTMLLGAREATRQAWASCAVRAEAGVLEATPWGDVGGYLRVDPNVRLVALSQDDTLQIIEVTATDPTSGRVAASTTVLKARTLSGSAPPANPTSPGAWCGYVVRPAP